MSPELTLAGLQRWMQTVIVHPGTTTEALASEQAAATVRPRRLASVILPSATLTAAERVGVYHGMYVVRMAEALESDYPALAHFLGEAGWRELVRQYVTAHPSRSYTLNHLGRELAGWLLEAPLLARREFCHDLARLEWAVAESFDAAETPRVGESELSAVPPDGWPRVRLVASGALRLLALRWNANEWLDSAKDEAHEHPRPRRRPTRLAVFRRNYSVYRRELSPAAYRLLADVVAGVPVGRALAAALRRRGAPTPETLRSWFRGWAADGLFSRVEIGG